MGNVNCVVHAESHDDNKQEHLSQAKLPVNETHDSKQNNKDWVEAENAQNGSHNIVGCEQQNDKDEAGCNNNSVDAILLDRLLCWNPAPGIIRRLEDCLGSHW